MANQRDTGDSSRDAGRFVFLALMVAAVAGLVYIAQPADKDVLPINDRPQETTSVQTTQSIDQQSNQSHLLLLRFSSFRG